MMNKDKNIGEKVKIKDGQTHIKSNDGKIYKIHETGTDQNGNKVLTASREAKWITPSILQNADGTCTSFDPNEECREMYNMNNFRVVFENCHYHMPRLLATTMVIVAEPFKHVFLPHGYYRAWAEFIGNKAPIEVKVLTIMGSDMFKGITKPSRPEEKKNFY